MKINTLILEAHHNLTYKKGRREYAPTSQEIEKEINNILNKVR